MNPLVCQLSGEKSEEKQNNRSTMETAASWRSGKTAIVYDLSWTFKSRTGTELYGTLNAHLRNQCANLVNMQLGQFGSNVQKSSDAIFFGLM